MNEVSLLQHNRDTSPQVVGIGQIVEMVSGEQWPPGYQPVLLVQGVFEGGTRQQDITRLSGLSAALFRGSDPTGPPVGQGSSLAELREEARADPHTLLLYTVGDDVVVVYPYELDPGYEVHLQRQFYQKAFLFGNDYYEQLTGRQSVRRERDAGRRCPLGHDEEVYYNPQAEPFLAWEIKEGCRRQSSRQKSTEGVRGRKPNYAELYMGLDEIEEWLTGHLELRRNVITMRTEYRWKDDRPPASPAGGGRWENFDDHTLNSVYRRMKREKVVRRDEIDWMVGSDYVGDYHPFLAYLDSLPPWDGDDYILALSATVSVEGTVDDQIAFYVCLKKWLVGMVAGWLHPDAVNQTVLVFVGRQGIYKTTWMNHLLPPELRSYFCSQAGVGRSDKDRELAMSQYGLICCEELDTMTASEMNAMKRAVTLSHIDARPAYGRYTEHRPHIASFCGTGNNEKFLNDPTGTRRWLAFKVEGIESPYTMPFEYAGIYAQAYHLYRSGFEYWFSDNAEAERRNSRFKVPNMERQLVYHYYRCPDTADSGEFVDVGTAMMLMGGIAQKLRKEAVEQAFIDLGFPAITTDGMSGYRAVRRLPEEINGLGRQMAVRAAREQDGVAQDPDLPDHF